MRKCAVRHCALRHGFHSFLFRQHRTCILLAHYQSFLFPVAAMPQFDNNSPWNLMAHETIYWDSTDLLLSFVNLAVSFERNYFLSVCLMFTSSCMDWDLASRIISIIVTTSVRHSMMKISDKLNAEKKWNLLKNGRKMCKSDSFYYNCKLQQQWA